MSSFAYKGRVWYYRLVSKTNQLTNGKKKKSIALMDKYPRDMIEDRLLIRMTKADGTFLYTIFENYIDFNTYQEQMQPQYRRFYEIVRGECLQKPHFDLDISLEQNEKGEIINDIDSDALVSDLIDCAYKLLYPYNIVLSLEKDILVYTSHGIGKNGSYKKSYHIIINNYCHNNNVEAKGFYNEVMKKLKVLHPNIPDGWIDPMVYSTTQNFRILGSSKLDANRPKIFSSSWNFRGEDVTFIPSEVATSDTHKNLLELSDSLISHCSDCRLLPNFGPKIDPNSMFASGKRYDDIPSAIAQAALALLANMIGIDVKSHKFPFEFNEITGLIVTLKRLMPTFCSMCDKTHEAEHPYLLVYPNKKVYYYCRRSKDKRIMVGMLKDTWQTGKNGEKSLKMLEDENLVIPHHNDKFHDSIMASYLESELNRDSNINTELDFKQQPNFKQETDFQDTTINKYQPFAPERKFLQQPLVIPNHETLEELQQISPTNILQYPLLTQEQKLHEKTSYSIISSSLINSPYPSPTLSSPILPSLTLSSPILPSPTLSSPILPSPTLPSPTLPSHTLPSHTLPSHTLSSPTLPSHTLPSHTSNQVMLYQPEAEKISLYTTIPKSNYIPQVSIKKQQVIVDDVKDNTNTPLTNSPFNILTRINTSCISSPHKLKYSNKIKITKEQEELYSKQIIEQAMKESW